MGRSLAGVISAALLTALMTATPAAATARPAIGFGCHALFGGNEFAGSVCAQVSGGQVSGTVIFLGAGNPTDIDTYLLDCNSTGTACTLVPGSRVASLQTPHLAAVAGAYYETCTYFVVYQITQGTFYNGCSPLVSA